ncbi:Uncharacterized protein OBRU01_00191 [Operophtera brumata]|uniref:Uncharacterized protein n=1 Tax=Operophtera brumata TaxID=104452 RepID=A0A0L7LVD1_OPEBR|nr:Uncharacterized protein OBRU01_00191 [Operophtera brumata]
MSLQGGMGGAHQGSPMQPQGGPMHAQNASMQSMLAQNSGHAFPSLHSSSFGHTADFNLDFLDNLPSTEASSLTAQELLNSLDNSFLNDIL